MGSTSRSKFTLSRPLFPQRLTVGGELGTRNRASGNERYPDTHKVRTVRPPSTVMIEPVE